MVTLTKASLMARVSRMGLSVTPARKAPQGASIIDQDQTREMLLANGFGAQEWEGIQLNGTPGGHTYMESFYTRGVLVHEALRDLEPMAWEFVMNFAKDNELQMREVTQEAT
mgnify:CR=1 FL=1